MKHLLGRLAAEVRATAGGLPPTYWFLWTGTLVNRLGSFVVPFLALYLTRERGFRVEEAGLVVSLHGAGGVLSGLVGGTLADRVGRRKTLLAGLWLGAAAMLSLGFSRATWLICTSAFLLGLLGELYRPAVSAAIADVVPPEDRARAYGLLYWVVNVGFSIALPLAGLASRFGFATLFVADACTSFLYGVLVWWKVPETRPAVPTGQADPSHGPPSLAPFRDTVFLAFALPILLTSIVFTQSNVTLPMDLTSHGMSPATFGTVLGMNGVLIVLLQPFAGRALGTMRRAKALAWASALTGLGFGLHGLGADVGLATLAVVVWTLGEIAQSPVASAVVADLAPPEQRGAYQGAYFMLWALSSCIAPTLGSWVLGHHGPVALWSGCLALGLFAAGWHLSAADARRRRMDMLRLTRSGVSAALD
ncbi:MFS transporter [Vitiosangium sp. GDMCC 1.1324]|uniref:MDR family MFS transporter n=1 Tax=Vitiosangium sp. (strain GDMCC 1.1324) TaxID=2138576 RepID=UPI000D36E2F5|nr:MFS transporter [Vitiosangium sp. GDMCC 1.1324]PTL81620.1 MFS transporter [Vitiosangium sp. GDMCC 1.1324]